MPCNYCGIESGLVPMRFRSADDDDCLVEVYVCHGCAEKYKSVLFDACDQCNVFQEIRPNTFHIIDGKVLCTPCKDASMVKR